MTDQEFTQWAKEHCEVFPAVREVLRGDAAREAWRDVLRGVDFQDARAATRAMLSGELEAKGHTQQPAAIRQFSVQQKRKRNQFTANGQRTYACKVCLDSGGIDIWDRRAMFAVAFGLIEFGSKGVLGEGEKAKPVNTLRRSRVNCTCRTGRDLNGYGTTYDPAYDVATEGLPLLHGFMDQQDRQIYIDHAERFREAWECRKPVGHVAAFDRFNEGFN